MKYLVEIDDDLVEQLHLMAGQEGLSPDQYLERAVKEGLERAKERAKEREKWYGNM